MKAMKKAKGIPIIGVRKIDNTALTIIKIKHPIFIFPHYLFFIKKEKNTLLIFLYLFKEF